MCSDTANTIVKYKRCIEAWHFISLDVAISCCAIFKMHDVHSVCFVNTDLRPLTVTCIICTCATRDSKMAAISWLNCPLFPYLKVVGCPLSCPLSCPLYPYMEVVGRHFWWKIPMGSPLRCPLSGPLSQYIEVVGSLICMAKFPWAAHSTAHWDAHFFIFGSSRMPTELPPVSIYGRSGQPNLHGKIPMGSPLRCPLSCPLFPYMEVVGGLIYMTKFPWAAHEQPTPLPTCNPWAAKWAAPPLFFRMGNWPKLSTRVFIFFNTLIKWVLYRLVAHMRTGRMIKTQYFDI